MRLDHSACRVADKEKTAAFLIECFGYRIAEDLPDGFEIEFEDNTKAQCLMLLPPEKRGESNPWSHHPPSGEALINDHMAREIFVSQGTAGSIVEKWVKDRGGIGGIHHLAYQVDSVANRMKEWKEQGYAEFTTPELLTCPGLVQVFSKPSQLSGVIAEIIERDKHGFCRENMKNLMTSTKDL
jgi:catechol 2,3-dioxygenase-like lactoylglutathione lyase family enzyme